jgi:DNA-binding transcriptional regulator LsrR (DeoR family)
VTEAALTTRLDEAAEAARLRYEKGMNGIQVAKAMGMSISQAYSLLADPEGSRNAGPQAALQRDLR